jgi:hypothetical protein
VLWEAYVGACLRLDAGASIQLQSHMHSFTFRCRTWQLLQSLQRQLTLAVAA